MGGGWMDGWIAGLEGGGSYLKRNATSNTIEAKLPRNPIPERGLAGWLSVAPCENHSIRKLSIRIERIGFEDYNPPSLPLI